MREQIAAARDYSTPEHFQKPEIPADATKVVIEFEGYGNVTIALMPQAPKHEEKFLALVDENFWDGQNVDEIQRDGESAWSKRPMQLHFGFASTKEADRTKWVKTDASEHQIAFEETGLSHFPGAVSARAGEDGKSAVGSHLHLRRGQPRPGRSPWWCSATWSRAWTLSRRSAERR